MVAWLRTNREFWMKLIFLMASSWFFCGIGIGQPPPPPIMNLLARNYMVQILPDGDVSVVEHWEVYVDNNPIPHLYFGIYSAHCTGISFGVIANAQRQTEVPVTSDGYLAERVEWFYQPVYRGIVTFDIPYIIHGALGMNQQQAWLDWHFLGGDIAPLLTATPMLNGASVLTKPPFTSVVTIAFPASVAAADQHVNVNFPGITPSVVALDSHTRQVRAFTLTTGHFLEIEGIFPRAALDASVQPPPWQTIAQPPTLPTALVFATTSVDWWIWLALGGIVIMFVFLFAVAWISLPAADERRSHDGYHRKVPQLYRHGNKPPQLHMAKHTRQKLEAPVRTRPHRHTHRGQHLSDA